MINPCFSSSSVVVGEGSCFRIFAWKMASLAILRSGQHVIRLNQILKCSSRSCGWVRDWKPGPPPVTEEERRAAARKYNLISEDYEWHDPSEGMGDYPKLPPVGTNARDPYDDFDYHYQRQNYGEPLHSYADYFTPDRHDPNRKERYTKFQMFAQFVGFFGGFGLLFAAGNYFDWRIIQPAVS